MQLNDVLTQEEQSWIHTACRTDGAYAADLAKDRPVKEVLKKIVKFYIDSDPALANQVDAAAIIDQIATLDEPTAAEFLQRLLRACA